MWVCGLHGRCLGGVWCDNQPSFWNQHPSNIETGLEMRGIEATKSAYPSSWPGGARFVGNTGGSGVISLDRSFLVVAFP